ncbi:hypothetical protein LAZ67_1008435 [Cordylochernes scorpioides]|uniref:Transposase n=1 Tax=Cordylochernes scorpioides TaxID=51811 RepID=A0ABY6K0F5_9ARAC|nr:hypothetical protein LAZ67_1008435 [Cordylochernes scorpioides]
MTNGLPFLESAGKGLVSRLKTVLSLSDSDPILPFGKEPSFIHVSLHFHSPKETPIKMANGSRLGRCQDGVIIQALSRDPTLQSPLFPSIGGKSNNWRRDLGLRWKGKDEPRTKKSRLCKSKNKVLLVTFFDIKGIVHYEYLEEDPGTPFYIINESYLNIMRCVRESILLKRSKMWSSKNWIIHHDNAPPHTATSVLTYLAKHGIQILQQPPYSSVLAPNDFFLFPKLKMALKGRRFDTRESNIVDSKKVLKNIPKDAISKCFKS